MLTLDKIYHAAFVLKDVARKTDLIEAPKLSKDCRLYLKTENLQVTGSFKVRGAYYKISQLSSASGRRAAACPGVTIGSHPSKHNVEIRSFDKILLLIYTGMHIHMQKSRIEDRKYRHADSG